MSESYTKTNSKPPTITVESLKDTIAKCNRTNTYSLLHSGVLEGVKVFPDLSGLMCNDNEYIVMVGRKLWDQMQAQCVIREKKDQPKGEK